MTKDLLADIDFSSVTNREFKFGMECLKGRTNKDAYVRTYKPKTTRRNSLDCAAWKVSSRPRVKKFIETSRRILLEEAGVTVQSLTEELEEARQLARETKQANAMVTATMGKARLNGLLKDNIVQVETKSLKEMLEERAEQG